MTRRSLIVVVMLIAGAAAPAAQTGDDTRPSFDVWLEGVRKEAGARGIRPEIVQSALGDLAPVPVILQRDRAQAEFTLSFDRYLRRRLTKKTIQDGRRFRQEYRNLLADVEQRYGVDSEVMIAVWAVESNFGRFIGVRPTVPVLATLAYDPRRATFFRGQLFDALEILNRGDIEQASLKGSWAGALGQVQFMPSSYLKFAVDFDGDGRRDIWASMPDVFASLANYLAEHGWARGERWGREVVVSKAARPRVRAAAPKREDGCRALRQMTEPLPLADWQAAGVRLRGGGALPKAAMNASLVDDGVRQFLVYPNYDVILAYNCAHSYALSVGLLSDAIAR